MSILKPQYTQINIGVFKWKFIVHRVVEINIGPNNWKFQSHCYEDSDK